MQSNKAKPVWGKGRHSSFISPWPPVEVLKPLYPFSLGIAADRRQEIVRAGPARLGAQQTRSSLGEQSVCHPQHSSLCDTVFSHILGISV